MDCIFCKIISGEVPCFKVFEDGDTLAFLDINPLTEGHVLVVPKQHRANLFEAGDDVLHPCISTLGRVARAMKEALGLDSLNMLQANGRWAQQSVDHLHFHLIPRSEDDGAPLTWDLEPGNMAVIKSLTEKIKAGLG
ncbi:MAG: HIT family protein [Deltaproteobacteria bacterium]|nr:HIT family protein [Deltaproteobacteria bacterium]